LLTASNTGLDWAPAKIWQQQKQQHPKIVQMLPLMNFAIGSVGNSLNPAWKNDFLISSDWLNESELIYSIQAPTVIYPWAGVPDAQVQATLNRASQRMWLLYH
jgi:hypothetical protein